MKTNNSLVASMLMLMIAPTYCEEATPVTDQVLGYFVGEVLAIPPYVTIDAGTRQRLFLERFHSLLNEVRQHKSIAIQDDYGPMALNRSFIMSVSSPQGASPKKITLTGTIVCEIKEINGQYHLYDGAWDKLVAKSDRYSQCIMNPAYERNGFAYRTVTCSTVIEVPLLIDKVSALLR